MKLDYLQYLELEIFTRFGAKLEASMEATIARGRVLREILKQDRLSPLPEAFQMAWLVAFNERLFSDVPLEHMQQTLKMLQQQVAASSLSLESAREDWKKRVTDWLASAPEAATS
jgi:F-type H+-transporting ATPase subunit alpha